jgi:nucleoid-associated protein YgaU
MPAQYEKLLIENQDSKDKFNVQYNPDKYSIEKSAAWEEKGKQADLQYGGAARKSISLEFFFDTYAARKDVRTEYVQKLLALMEPTVSTSGGKKRPPILLLSWGGFAFRSVLEKLSQNYTMFSESGVPVRAVVNATFKQYSTAEEGSRNNPVGDPTKTHRVTQGETLSAIAEREYSDPGLWRIIADANRLADPRRLEPGMLLVIPALI